MTPHSSVSCALAKANGQWALPGVLVFNLTDEMLFELSKQPLPTHLTQGELLAAIVDAYDLRWGWVETTIKAVKAGSACTTQ